ncbi:protein jag [Paenalkalicoccus suaedae]|uniref:RNA-binding protein KhpB n=1 Tax=Paenalkalicoccus suaedae TaxID=2592382 RepID=A0A859FJZ1_9BACI|nr:RNA-binding cell elongation regulator Jag/EloR [Paenalkalicoccus suaedae]QKS73113.1 protein jag [Paenalkalicoccus suaedae]
MNKVTVSGKTVEEAIELGLKKLDATKDSVTIDVIEEAQKGFLGLIGGKPAVVELRLKPDPVKEALVFLRETIDKMGVAASVATEKRQEGIYFLISGTDIGVLIGKRGQTLDSLQYLVNLVANKHSENYVRIYLDAEGYRERRKQTLIELAERVANKAARTKREVHLEPMSAHERKIIHSALQNVQGIETRSDGREPHRRIVVIPK